MIAWLKGLANDEARFRAAARGLIGMAGGLVTLLPASTYAKYGPIIMAVGMFVRAGDKNPK